jgi:MerR family transcriptional regulator, light-induced transcriptional regulator
VEEDRISEAQLAVTAAAVTGDAGALYHLISGLLGDGVPLDTILFDLLLPAERGVGARWQQGDYLISEEHAATATVETVVALLAGAFDRPAAGNYIVIATAEGDTHSLAARAVAAHLLFLGYRTVFLGADVPASDLGEYLQAEQPEALVLSCAMANHLLGARASIKAAHRAGVPVLVGGRGFGESGVWAGPLGADAWAETPRDVAGILGSWSPDPHAAESNARNPSRDLLVLSGKRPEIVGAALSTLSVARGDSDPRLRGELEFLLDAVAASALVDDNRLLAEVLRWQRPMWQAHGFPAPDAIVAALGDSLSSSPPNMVRMFNAAAEVDGV